MGGAAKGMLRLGTGTVLDEIVSRLRHQAYPLLLNLQVGDDRYGARGIDILPEDADLAGSGPLTGILAALDWAVAQDVLMIATVAVDTPFLPPDLLTRFAEAVGMADAAYAVSNGRRHPVAALWRARLAPELRRAMTQEGLRKVEDWLDRIVAVPVAFHHRPIDPFFNINTPPELVAASAWIRSRDR